MIIKQVIVQSIGALIVHFVIKAPKWVRMIAAFSFFFTHYRPFPLFLFICLSLLTVLFLFLGASIVCVSNTIYRGQQIVL